MGKNKDIDLLKSALGDYREEYGAILDKKRVEALYELYCLADILDRVGNAGFVVKVENRQHEDRLELPAGPGEKSNFPYFVLFDKDLKEICQICTGTTVKDEFGDTYAPDISFQKQDADLSPTFEDLIAIWDAKYRYKLGHKLELSIVDSFLQWIEALDVQQGTLPNNVASCLGIKQNALLTNQKESTRQEERLKKSGLSEVTNHFPKKNRNVRP